MTGSRFVLASHNQHKCRELRKLLAPLGTQLVSLDSFSGLEQIEETGSTFEENARLKAEGVCRQTHLATIADDSGLEVRALDNQPGIYSARFANPEANDSANNQLLLRRMQSIPNDRRQARFVCVIAFKYPGQDTITFRGEATGSILRSPQGNSGFGYDPLFLSDPLGISFAQATAQQKSQVSHRANALRKLIAYLKDQADSGR